MEDNSDPHEQRDTSIEDESTVIQKENIDQLIQRNLMSQDNKDQENRKVFNVQK